MKMKTVFQLLFLCLVAALFLTGCTGLSGVGDGRMAAWKDVRTAEEGTKQEFLKTKQEEIKAKKSDGTTQNPTMKLTAYDENGKVVSTAEMDLQPMLAELGLGKEVHTYGVDLEKTAIPKGQIAETLNSAGDAATSVAGAPAVLSYAIINGVTKAVNGRGTTTIDAEEVTISDSLNDTEVRATGEGNAVSADQSKDSSSTEIPKATVEG